MRTVGFAAIGVLATACAGLGASTYTIANINPIYFAGSDSRRAQPSHDDAQPNGLSYASSATFPSPPGGQYYYYRPPPVTASYDAVPPSESADVNPQPEPDRDRAIDRELDAALTADSESRLEKPITAPASDSAEVPPADDKAAVAIAAEPRLD